MYPYNISRTSSSQGCANEKTLYASAMQKKEPASADKRVLEMIGQALADETNDIYNYKQLMTAVRNEKDKEVLRSIYLDEMKHRKMFEEIYFLFTSQNAPQTQTNHQPPSLNIEEEYSKALFDEMGAVEFYRQILFAIDNKEIRDMMYEIITDEQKHADKLNYLLTKLK